MLFFANGKRARNGQPRALQHIQINFDPNSSMVGGFTGDFKRVQQQCVSSHSCSEKEEVVRAQELFDWREYLRQNYNQ